MAKYVVADFDINHTHRLIFIVPRNTTSQRVTGRILKQIPIPTSNTFTNLTYYMSEDKNKYYILSTYHAAGTFTYVFLISPQSTKK